MIEDILRQSEGKTLEFKENSKPLLSIIKTVIAFANTAGGLIVLGIEDKTKTLKGIENSLLEEEKLSNAIADNVCPLIMPDIEIQTYRNKELIIIRVPHAVGPFFLKSEGIEKGTYIRLGSTNRIVDATTLEVLKLLSKNISFDEIPHFPAKADSLNWVALKSEFKKVNKNIDEEKAKVLGILTDNLHKSIPTNGGILLYGKNKFKIFPQSTIRCARFLTPTRETIIDQSDIETNMPESIEMVISFIRRNTTIGLKIGKVKSKEICEYPTLAIREAVINAILHADYSIQGSNIQIAIFNDRIEFTNPGSLPFGLTLANALAGSSKLRNKVIGKVFRELNLIEQWGSGLQRIISECEKANLKLPKFEELGNQFRVTIFNSKIEQKLETWKNQIIDYLRENKEINTTKAAELWNISDRTAYKRLKQLMDEQIISRIGTSLKDPFSVYILYKELLK